MGKLTTAWIVVLMTGMASVASGPPSDGAPSPSQVVDNAHKRQVVVRAFKWAVLVPAIDVLHSRHVRFKLAAAHHRLRCAAWGHAG